MITDVIVHFNASDTIAFEVSYKIKFSLIAHWTEWRGECAREATGASSMLRLIRYQPRDQLNSSSERPL